MQGEANNLIVRSLNCELFICVSNSLSNCYVMNVIKILEYYRLAV